MRIQIQNSGIQFATMEIQTAIDTQSDSNCGNKRLQNSFGSEYPNINFNRYLNIFSLYIYVYLNLSKKQLFGISNFIYCRIDSGLQTTTFDLSTIFNQFGKWNNYSKIDYTDQKSCSIYFLRQCVNRLESKIEA